MVPYPHRRRSPHSIFTKADVTGLADDICLWGQSGRGNVAHAWRDGRHPMPACKIVAVTLPLTLEKTVTPDVSKEGFGQAAATQDESRSAIIARDRQLAKLGYLNERGAV